MSKRKTEIKTIYGQINGVVAHAMATEGKVHMIGVQHIPADYHFNEHGEPAVCALVFTPEAEREFDKRVADLRA
jgi:hypothetical protein